MFYRYEIRNKGHEEILYLYLTMAYEFSRELTANSSDDEMRRRTKNFIANNDIKFNGNKVYLVIDGVVVKSLDMSISKDTDIIPINNDSKYSNNNFLVKVKLQDSSLIEISLKDFLLGVLATSFFPLSEDEVLKSICILFRTYAYKMMDGNNYIDEVNDFCRYGSIFNFKNIWNKEYENNYKRLEKIVDDTECLFLTYNNSYILPFIHFTNNGKTRTDKNYPYLTSVISLWDLTSYNYIQYTDYSYEEISKILNTSINSKTNFEIISCKDKIYLEKLKINNNVYSGEELKILLNLKSLEVKFILNRDYIRVITIGWGNSMGLSIFGANELAKNGGEYSSILKYYFPKVKLCQYKKELS